MIADIWRSFRRMPLWVQIWVAFFLVPANLLPLLFLGEPLAFWVAGLSVGGMLPNLAIMIAERGLSKRMALPHVLIWTPLVILVGWMLLAGGARDGSFYAVLMVVLVIDLISLAFDYSDLMKWRNGDREIA
jgi:hypothetical protein